MVGINSSPHKPAELKEVMDKEIINWRTFADDGSIHRKWNSPATPSFYVLDRKGVIRHKWIGHPGEQTIDAALDQLIRETEDKNRN